MEARPIPKLTLDESRRYWRSFLIGRRDDCWNWTAPATTGRYGMFKVQGDKFLPHRISWTLHFGDIPPGQCVCHSCDNPRCVNPLHLFLGTHQDNMDDKMRKGRHVIAPDRRVYITAAKLNADEVLAIRADCRSQRAIAAEYGVNQSTISDIKRGELWAHL